ncbi:hypothetical protein JRQ81_018492 [Phrynocephalus forsythii]|uniref:Uncharacterized protein n=1 Tax=Phrynocephalus forsythii TaxID=171643 RepID=A0A9Q1AZ51_9SAUR|nr:hypothetical protein JRQ81_018492 [Phrynocephalus forsythii]
MFGDPFAAWRWLFPSKAPCTAYFVTLVGKRQLSASLRDLRMQLMQPPSQ